MIEREEKLINAAREIIFTARLRGNDLAQFGRKVAEILLNHGLLEKEAYEVLTGRV